jgi:co-chaperonin GroES (HSP10)
MEFAIDFNRLRPLHNQVMVWLDPGEQQTKSGLIIPPQFQQITQHGQVLKVSNDLSDSTITIGCTVLIDLNTGIEVGYKQNTPVLLVDVKNIQAILS